MSRKAVRIRCIKVIADGDRRLRHPRTSTNGTMVHLSNLSPGRVSRSTEDRTALSRPLAARRRTPAAHDRIRGSRRIYFRQSELADKIRLRAVESADRGIAGHHCETLESPTRPFSEPPRRARLFPFQITSSILVAPVSNGWLTHHASSTLNHFRPEAACI